MARRVREKDVRYCCIMATTKRKTSIIRHRNNDRLIYAIISVMQDGMIMLMMMDRCLGIMFPILKEVKNRLTSMLEVMPSLKGQLKEESI